ncbi:probable sodium/metabolite cotransporter BASS4, chloroplastic [Selaginella moellendorffii]|uniref:probable sodium/metabolite cotransporter BASS4, chloroplastic n=1 Tax=Selaginella moellendorffii TaxID=88036 RepID=UPI000D1CD059|nr:probable sodium/metabolite cotransporter BASS4, chloroplastic [Selaginella moellendorffii]|eukprot:XP_024527048.1 probable sodium/metabolite cotransporter BASS4, chloroplastic [Selaginella moellendorffii]
MENLCVSLVGATGRPWTQSKRQSKLNRRVIAAASMSRQEIKRFVSKNFVSLALIGGMSIGMLEPRPGQFAQHLGLSRWATAGIFLLSGFTLQDGDINKALEAWPFALQGLISILFITPAAALLVMQIKLNPKELVTGLAIFCCAPTTLSTGVSLTQLAGANKALALALTISSNLLAVFTMPVSVSLWIGKLGIKFPASKLFRSLVQTLVLPFAIGKLLREVFCFYHPAESIDRHREEISFASALLLSSVPWMQISSSRSLLLQLDARNLIAALFLGIALHFMFLAVNMFLVSLIKTGSKEDDEASSRAVILVASQKTLPVSVAVVETLKAGEGSGLLVLPCIAAHFSQIILDSILVGLWNRGKED